MDAFRQLHRKMAKKRRDLRLAHFPRMALAVEYHEPSGPVRIRVFGSNTVAPYPCALPHGT